MWIAIWKSGTGQLPSQDHLTSYHERFGKFALWTKVMVDARMLNIKAQEAQEALNKTIVAVFAACCDRADARLAVGQSGYQARELL